MIKHSTSQKPEKQVFQSIQNTQVIGCRVSKEQWHQFEQKCLANRVSMSLILQQAVGQYINN